jgi:hypothetical protein
MAKAKITQHTPAVPDKPLSKEEKVLVESAMQCLLSVMDNHGLKKISFNDGSDDISKKRNP